MERGVVLMEVLPDGREEHGVGAGDPPFRLPRRVSPLEPHPSSRGPGVSLGF